MSLSPIVASSKVASEAAAVSKGRAKYSPKVVARLAGKAVLGTSSRPPSAGSKPVASESAVPAPGD